MSSREEILANIRKNTQKRFDYPEWQIKTTVYPDVVTEFCEMTRAVGGEAMLLGKEEDVNAVIRRTYPEATRIASDLDEVTCATFNPDELDRAQDLDGTDIAVVAGELGVAENAAVWIPQTVKYKALYFIAEKLVIILDRNRIVSNMHEAYEIVKNEKYECKILKDAYEMIDEPIHKSFLLDINKNILFETINDSFWLGVILTVEDNLEDYQMKNILSAFLLHFSSIFCQEVVKYKLGEIINPELSNNSNLKKMRNSYLKDTPLYDSKKIKKVIEEMGINFDKDGIFDIVLYMLDNELIDINSRNWNVNKINNYEMYNGIICSPRRWIKNQLAEEINNDFEKLRKEIVEQIIKKFSEIKIIPKSYSTKRLSSPNFKRTFANNVFVFFALITSTIRSKSSSLKSSNEVISGKKSPYAAYSFSYRK